jgi:beta-glucosidase
MKSNFVNRKPLTSLLALLSMFLLAGAGLVSCSTSANRSTASVSATARDVSEFPHDEALVPGKGPMQTWQRLSAASDRNAVVFLGDSITQGWTSLAKDFPNLHVANRGISGDTTRGVLYRVQAGVIDLEPEAVVLLIGTNDIGLGASPEDIADNVREILRQLRKSNRKMPVIVCKVMPRADRNLHVEEKIKKLNSLVDEIVKSDRRFVRCDTWSIYVDEQDHPRREEFPDLLHPNAAGYAKWTTALKPLVAELNLGKGRAM